MPSENGFRLFLTPRTIEMQLENRADAVARSGIAALGKEPVAYVREQDGAPAKAPLQPHGGMNLPQMKFRV